VDSNRVDNKVVPDSRVWKMTTAAIPTEAVALDRVAQAAAWVPVKDKMIYKLPIDLPGKDDILFRMSSF
jgi:hypothetical protein